jgi:hypothetical protein
VLNQLESPQPSHYGLPALPDPCSIIPYMGLYAVVPLVLEVLERMDFIIFNASNPSQLRDNRWITVPPKVTPDALIYNAMSLSPTSPLQPETLDFSKVEKYRRLWRLPISANTVLTTLLHNVSHLGKSDVEEVQLAIEIRSLLALNCVRGSGSGNGGGRVSKGGDLNRGGSLLRGADPVMALNYRKLHTSASRSPRPLATTSNAQGPVPEPPSAVRGPRLPIHLQHADTKIRYTSRLASMGLGLRGLVNRLARILV